MKNIIKNIKNIALFATFALMTVSCVENNLEGYINDGVIRYELDNVAPVVVKSSQGAREISPIVLTSEDGQYSITLQRSVSPMAQIEAVSKAAPVTGTTIKDNYNDGSLQITAFNGENLYMPQQKLTFVSQEAGQTASLWKTENTFYWPDSQLKFWSWAPASESAADGKISGVAFNEDKSELSFTYTSPKSGDNNDAELQKDVLLAYDYASSADARNVNLMYKHALSALCFQVDRANKCTVKSVSLSNVYDSAKCTFDGTDIVWSDYGEAKGFKETFDKQIEEYMKDDYANPQTLSTGNDEKTFLLIPQTATEDRTVTMSIVLRLDGASEDITLSAELNPDDAIWEAGYTYTYGLSMGQSQIIYHWNDSGRSTHTHPHTGDAEIFEQTGMIESGIYDITLHEPLWEPENLDDYYKFLGWATSSTATAAEYVQQGRSQSTGLPYQISVHSETVDLYAVWEKVDNPGAWVDYQAYNMNAFAGFRFDHIDSWEFNKSFAFTSNVSRGFEKIGFPIHNLEVGRWYTITFSEDVLPHEKAYNVQSGVFGNTVHESSDDIKPYNKGSMITYTTDATATNPVIHAWTHTVSDNTWGEDAVHIPMSNQQTTFYASAETMWWIWDLSKLCDYEQKQYNISHSKIEMMSEPTGPAIDFRNASFHGFKFKAFHSDEDDKSDSSADNKGRSTYKVKSDFTSSEMKMWGTENYEKINIPMINLEPGATYKLSFNYTLEALYCSDSPIHWIENDFCFGVRPEKNTKTSKGNFKDTEGYSSYITTNIADCQNKYMEMTFTVPEDKNTMYFIWSLSGLSDHTFFHQLITNAKLEKL